MIDVALHSLIAQHAGVSTRVTPSTETVFVSKDLPRVVYTLIDTVRTYSDKGNSGLVRARYQLDIFAAKVTEARAVADALRIGLESYAGTTDDTKVDRIYFDSEQFAKGDRVEGANQITARFSQDLIVVYREATS